MEQQAVYQARAAKTQATIEANARLVFGTHRSWRFAHRKVDNHPFFMMDGTGVRVPSGDVVTPTYYVDLHDCTCDSHRKGRVACKHMRAVRLWFEAVKRGEIVVYRRMTAGDRAALEADSLLVEELDVAEAADSLLDTYHEQQARRRASRLAEPEQDWWLTGDNGGIVWLQEGDRIGPDTAMERPIDAQPAMAAAPAVPAPAGVPAPVRSALRSYEDLFGADDTEHS